MEKNSKIILKSMLEQFMNRNSINNILIIDENGKVLVSSQKLSPEIKSILNFFIETDIIKLKNNVTAKNLEKIILEYIDYQIILAMLQNKNYILAITNNKENFPSILNELSSLIEQINDFFLKRNGLEKFHKINLDGNIKKLEEYLKLMQPPRFKNIKKLIEYIS
ncbi:MAG: hypothetical protein ACFFDN_09295 [Candidatus Hodarchaeota archaeon]